METYNLKQFRQRLLDINYNPDKVAYASEFSLFEDITQIDIAQQPTRLKMMVLGLVLEGECDIVIDTQEHHLSQNSYVVLHPNQVVHYNQSDGNTSRGIFICLSSDLSSELLKRMQDILPLFLYIKDNPCAALSAEDAKWIEHDFRNIFTEISNTSNIFREQTAQALLIASMYKIFSMYALAFIENDSNEVKNRQDEIFKLFIEQLSKDFMTHREVSYYADCLCITPKYLSTVVKQVSGQGANSWIQHYVIQEAKRQLQTTHKNIQQISNDLSFPSQSFFGKYFKHLTGMSPNSFRKRLQ